MKAKSKDELEFEKLEQQAWTEYYQSIKQIIDLSQSPKEALIKFASTMMAMVQDLTAMPHEEIFQEVEETIEYAKRNPTGWTFDEID